MRAAFACTGHRSANLIVATLTALAIAALLGRDADAASGDRKIAGYYVSWGAYQRNYTPRDIDARRFTHIIYAFADIVRGEVALADAAIDRSNLAELRRLRSENGRPKLLVAVGGWAGSQTFSDIATTDRGRRRFADSAVALLRGQGLDGIDVDWEYPVAGGAEDNSRRSEDKANLTLLLQALRAALDMAGRADGKTYLLTVAAGAFPEYVANTELAKIARTVDWVGLMGYDFAGPWSKTSGHNAPLFADPASPAADAAHDTVAAAVARVLAAGVPPAKLLLGLPLFGHTWRGCDSGNDGEYRQCSGPAKGTWEDGTLDYRDIAAHYLTNRAFARHFNPLAKVPFLFDAGSGQFISYDDPESFGYKIDFLKEKRLGGVMYWELSADREGGLLDRVAGELRREHR